MMAAKKPAPRIKVTLRRSTIGQKPKVRATVRGLGLTKLNSSNELPDTDSVQGMIHKVRHLVVVSEADRAPAKR
jgi:large subunit ribosomal protein L30